MAIDFSPYSDDDLFDAAKRALAAGNMPVAERIRQEWQARKQAEQAPGWWEGRWAGHKANWQEAAAGAGEFVENVAAPTAGPLGAAGAIGRDLPGQPSPYVDIGKLEEAQEAGPVDVLGTLPDTWRSAAERNRKIQQLSTPENVVGRFMTELTDAGIMMAPALVTGRAGGQVIGYTMFSIPAFGMGYSKGLERFEGNHRKAMLEGLIEVAKETGSEKIFGVLDKLGVSSKAKKEIAKLMLREAGSEAFTEAVNDFDNFLRFGETKEDFWEALKGIGWAAGLGAALGTGIGGFSAYSASNETKILEEQEAYAEELRQDAIQKGVLQLLDPANAQYERVSAAEAQRRAAEAKEGMEFDTMPFPVEPTPIQAPEEVSGEETWQPAVIGRADQLPEDDVWAATFNEAAPEPAPVQQPAQWPAGEGATVSSLRGVDSRGRQPQIPAIPEQGFDETLTLRDSREWQQADSVAVDLTEEQQVEWDLFNQRMDEVRAQEADMWSKLSFAKQTSGDPSDMSLEELREWEDYSRTVEDVGVGINEQSSLEEKINRDIELEGLKSEETKRWAYAANSDNVTTLKTNNYVVTDFDPTTGRVWADYRTDNGVVHYTWIVGETLPRLYRKLPEGFQGTPTPQDYKVRHSFGGAKFEAKRTGLKSDRQGFAKDAFEQINRALSTAVRYGTPEIVLKDVRRAEQNKARLFSGVPNQEMARQQLINEAKRAYRYEMRTRKQDRTLEGEAEFVENYLLQQENRVEQTREAVRESLGNPAEPWNAIPKFIQDGGAKIETWISDKDRADLKYGRTLEARAYQILPNGDVRTLRLRPSNDLSGYDIVVIEQNGQPVKMASTVTGKLVEPRMGKLSRRLTNEVRSTLEAINKPTVDEKFGVMKARADAAAQAEEMRRIQEDQGDLAEMTKELAARERKLKEKEKEAKRKDKPEQEPRRPTTTETLYEGQAPQQGTVREGDVKEAPAAAPKEGKYYRKVTISGVEHHAQKLKYDPNEPEAWVVWPVGMPRSTAQPVAKNLEQLMQVVQSGTSMGVPLVNDELRQELAKRGEFDTTVTDKTELGAKPPKQQTLKQTGVERPAGLAGVESSEAAPTTPTKTAKDRGETILARTEPKQGKLTIKEQELANTYTREFTKDGVEYQAAKEGGQWLVWRKAEPNSYVVAGSTVPQLNEFIESDALERTIDDKVRNKGAWAGNAQPLYQDTRDVDLYDSTLTVEISPTFFKERTPTYDLAEVYDRTLREQRAAERQARNKQAASKEYILRSRSEHKAAKDKFLQRLLDKIETVVENNSNNVYHTMLEGIVESAPSWLQQMVPAARTPEEALQAFDTLLEDGTYQAELAKALKADLRATLKEKGLKANKKLSDELVDTWLHDRSARKEGVGETDTLERGKAVRLTAKGKQQLGFAKKLLKSLMSGRAIEGATAKETELLSAYVDLPSKQIIAIAQGIADYIALNNPDVPTASPEATMEEIIKAYITTDAMKAVRELQAQRNRAINDNDARGEADILSVQRQVVLESLTPTLAKVMPDTVTRSAWLDKIAPVGGGMVMPGWKERIDNAKLEQQREWRSEESVKQADMESRPAQYRAPEKDWTRQDIDEAIAKLDKWFDEQWAETAELRGEIAALQDSIREDAGEGVGLSEESIRQLKRLERYRTLLQVGRKPRKTSKEKLALEIDAARLREEKRAEQRAAAEARLERQWEGEDAEEAALQTAVQQEMERREQLRQQAANEAEFKAKVEQEKARVARLAEGTEDLAAPEYERDDSGAWVRVREAEIQVGDKSPWGMAIANDLVTEIPTGMNTRQMREAVRPQRQDTADLPGNLDAGLGPLLVDPIARDAMFQDIWKEANTLSGQEQWRNSFTDLGQEAAAKRKLGKVRAKPLTDDEIIKSAHSLDLEDPNPVKQSIFSWFTTARGNISPFAWMPPKVLKYIAQSKYAGLYDPMEVMLTRDKLEKKQLKSRREVLKAGKLVKGEVQRAVNLSRAHWALAKRELKKAGWKRQDPNWDNALNSYLEGVSAENVKAEYGVTISERAQEHLNKWTSYANLIALYGAQAGSWSRDSTRGAVIGGRAYLSHTAKQTDRTKRQLIEKHIPTLRELAKQAWSLPDSAEAVDKLGRNALINLLNDTTHGLWSQYLGRAAEDTATEAGSQVVFDHNGVTVNFGKGKAGKISKDELNKQIAAVKDPVKQDELRQKQLDDLRRAVKAGLPGQEAYEAAITNIANAAIDIEQGKGRRGFGASTAIQQQRRLMKSHAELIDDAMSLIKIGKSRDRKLKIESFFNENRERLREMTVPQFMTEVTKKLGLNKEELRRATAHLSLNSKLRHAINEITDTETLMARTVENIAATVYTSDFLTTILTTGVANNWASYKQRSNTSFKPLAEPGTALGDATVYFPGTTRFVKASEIFVDPQVAEFVQDMFGADADRRTSWFMEKTMRASGIVKYMKVVASPLAHPRNFVSTRLIHWKNNALGFGMVRSKWIGGKMSTGQALSALAERIEAGIEAKKSPEVQMLEEWMTTRGLLFDGGRAGAMYDLRNEGVGAVGPDTFHRHKYRRFGKRAKYIADELFRLEDESVKASGFLMEAANFLEITGTSQKLLDKGLKGERMTPAEQEQLQKALDYAAEVVSNTYPTFSNTSRLMKAISRNPLFGAFPSFSYEVARTSANSVIYAAHLLRAGATGYMHDGTKLTAKGQAKAGMLGLLKLGGVAAMWSAGSAAIQFVASSVKDMLDGDDEEEDGMLSTNWLTRMNDSAYQRETKYLKPWWAENTPATISEIDPETGKYTMMSIDYVMPTGAWETGLMQGVNYMRQAAATGDKNVIKAAAGATITVLGDIFLNEEVLWGSFWERTQRKEGRLAYKDDRLLSKWGDWAQDAVTAGREGTAVNTITSLAGAAAGALTEQLLLPETMDQVIKGHEQLREIAIEEGDAKDARLGEILLERVLHVGGLKQREMTFEEDWARNTKSRMSQLTAADRTMREQLALSKADSYEEFKAEFDAYNYYRREAYDAVYWSLQNAQRRLGRTPRDITNVLEGTRSAGGFDLQQINSGKYWAPSAKRMGNTIRNLVAKGEVFEGIPDEARADQIWEWYARAAEEEGTDVTKYE